MFFADGETLGGLSRILAGLIVGCECVFIVFAMRWRWDSRVWVQTNKPEDDRDATATAAASEQERFLGCKLTTCFN